MARRVIIRFRVYQFFLRAYRLYKRAGIRQTIVRFVAKILHVEVGIQLAKNKAYKILSEKYDFRVAYGPFKGMQLNKNIWWSRNDLITQTLGIYEEHILEKIKFFSKYGATAFIDIGAADGYFAVGMAYSKLYEKVYAFEIEEDGRNRIIENALRNNCEKKIQVFGKANLKSIKKITAIEKKATFLIDIEGSEYDFLDTNMLEALANHFVICELHPWLVNDGEMLQEKLLESASSFFDVDLIKRESYNPNNFSDFDNLSDEERLIAVGEGRERNMYWMILSPRNFS